MKIYFIASPRLVVLEPEFFRKIHLHLSRNHQLLSDLLLKWTDKDKKQDVNTILNISHQDRVEKVKTALKMLNKCDVVIMEISGHSMSMGYLTSKALEMSKPVIYLQKKESDPHWMDGLEDSKLITLCYTEENVFEKLDQAIEKAREMIDVRFNFFVSPKILAYMDWVAQKRMKPRSVFLRNLIEKQIRKEKEFKG